MLLERKCHNEGEAICVVVFDLSTCSRFADEDLGSRGNKVLGFSRP